jgi:3-hydroxyisobutyrate dehydrogenase-like beta-hydroxyacid dehydrogenase
MKFGFIGFGEVGRIFSQELHRKGGEVLVYDVLLDQPEQAPLLQARISQAGAVAGCLSHVAGQSEYLFSAVTTEVAKAAASSCSQYVKPGQSYIDLNSTSPSLKVDIGRIIEARGAEFLEGAVLGAVGATGANTRILLGGAKAQATADLLGRFGLNVSFYSTEIGKASTFKMLRSIFSKGIEALLLEMLVAGKRAGIEKDLWEDISQFMASKPFQLIASNWIQSHAVAHRRRYLEMVQVAETMQEIGIPALLTERTAAFFRRSVDQEMNVAFTEKPASLFEVVDFIESKLRPG